MVQGGIVDSQLVSVTSADSGQMRVTMSFDLDMKSGQEYGQMSAQNMTLKAHLGELSDAAASNPVSRAALSDEAKRKYESMASISGTTSTVRSGLATSKLGGQVKLANTTVCNRDYQVVSVKDFSIQPGLNDTVNAQATVVVKAIVDDCAEHHFTVGSWLGQTRTMTVIGFGRGSYSGNLSNADPRIWGSPGRSTSITCRGNWWTPTVGLKADSGDRTTHLNWGYKILDTVQSENEVVQLPRRGCTALPADLLRRADFKVCREPNAFRLRIVRFTPKPPDLLPNSDVGSAFYMERPLWNGCPS